MAKLIFQNGELRGEHPLSPKTTLGRGPDNDFRLMDRLVSGRHAHIVQSTNGWYFQDLGSSNGSFVNGNPCTEHYLKEGDEIALGSIKITFSEAPMSEGEAVPQVSIGKAAAKAPEIHSRIDGSKQAQFAPVENIQDIEELKRDYEKLRIANELNQAIGLEPDIDKLLENILEETFRLLSADRGVILLMDPQSHQLVPRAVKRRDEETDEIVLSNTVIAEVFGSGAAVLTSDATLDDRFSGAKSVMVMGLRSTMCVPMIYRSQLLGIIHLDSLFARGAFSNKDLQILSGLAAQAARAIDNAYKARELERNALARRDFEKLLPPEIVEQVVSGKVHLQRGGELRETTILFSDVRGFTQWSEKHKPSYIVSILNDYFELMVDAIHRHHGTLDKFMGDGIMALFGAPIAHGEDALNAVRCSLDMMEALGTLNERLKAFEQEEVAIGIGINNGPVIAGYMGSSKSMEYTAIGDHVNLAARLCGVAEPGQILLSQNTVNAIGSSTVQLRSKPPVRVKGKSEPVAIYEVVHNSGMITGESPVIPDPGNTFS